MEFKKAKCTQVMGMPTKGNREHSGAWGIFFIYTLIQWLYGVHIHKILSHRAVLCRCTKMFISIKAYKVLDLYLTYITPQVTKANEN